MDTKIQTYTGEFFDFSKPHPDMVNIWDIAHSLSNSCRFGGHTIHFYSVAEHSIILSNIVEDKDKLWALLHDATEAYIKDIPRPLKFYLGDTMKELERNVLEAIKKKYGLTGDIPNKVNELDIYMLFWEAQSVMQHKLWESNPEEHMAEKSYKLFEGVERPKFLPPEKAEAEFLMVFKQLTKQ